MKQVEGNVYLCSWKRQGGEIVTWLRDDPTLSARGKDFNEAYEDLWMLVCGRFGDGEAYLEFDRSPPKSAAFRRFQTPEVLTLETNSLVDFSGDFTEMYESGVCQNCRSPIGSRNETTLKLTKRPNVDKLLVRNRQMASTIYSEDFIKLFGLRKQHIELREVEFASTKGKRFFEIISADLIETCAVKSFERMDIRKGFQCRTCARKQILYIVPNFPVRTFIAESDLPKREVFLIGRKPDYTSLWICARKRKWEAARGLPGTKGIVTGQLGIVPKSEVIRDPSLEVG